MNTIYKFAACLYICAIVIVVIVLVVFLFQVGQPDIRTLAVEKTKCFLVTTPAIVQIEFDTAGRLYGVGISGDAALSPQIPCNLRIVP